MTEDEIRQFDESMTTILRTFPGMLWSLYKAFCEEGFTETQALDLTKEYLNTTIGKR